MNPFASASRASSESARTVVSDWEIIATRMAEFSPVRLGDCTGVITVTSLKLSTAASACEGIHAYPNQTNSSSLRKNRYRPRAAALRQTARPDCYWSEILACIACVPIHFAGHVHDD